MPFPEELFLPTSNSAAYTPAALEACRRALATLVKQVGMFGPNLVVVGGLAPHFLIPTPPEGIEAHIGTTDIDLAISLYVNSDDEELYATLQNALHELDFMWTLRKDERGFSYWRWQRNVDGIDVLIEFLCPEDGVHGVGRVGEPSKLKDGDELGALRMPGAELAGIDKVACSLEAELLDRGGIATPTVYVANLLPMIVLKGLAIAGRNKDKDSYDVVWLLNAWPGGARGAARDAWKSPVAAHSKTIDGLQRLRQTFQSEGHEGPMRYARFFLAASEQDDVRLRLARYAYGTVEAFFQEWDAHPTVA